MNYYDIILFIFIISVLSTFVVFLKILYNKILKKEKLSSYKKWFLILAIGLYLFLIYFMVMYIQKLTPDSSVNLKPIIYLYPTNETNVSVELGYKDKITCSYPKYKDKWNVIAKPDSNLLDLDTGLNLYSLYYESDNVVKFKVEDEGFCIKGENISYFLENSLTKLGLNYKEREEFIVYWLPKLEKNKYNYIRFANENEISANMPLNIKPFPDTLIRILMVYKPLNHPISVDGQTLTSKDRIGFTAVEWGGTEIK